MLVTIALGARNLETSGHRGCSHMARNSKMARVASQKIASEVASVPKAVSEESLSRLASRDHMVKGVAGNLALFLLKVAALETTRRVSQAKCPVAWRGLQAFQMLCYPPLKWVRRWAPFKGLVQGMQMLSRPLLVLSIATAFTDKSDNGSTSDDHSISQTSTNLDEESSFVQLAIDKRDIDDPICSSSEDWLLKLYEELEKQGISLPERINKNELRRFYSAADGNFSCFLSSIKKTIRWRETFGILSEKELKMWSNAVFWHGCDVRQRPCLIVRLGVACTSLPNHDRPRFCQAIVSQMEHGLLYLADRENPQIVVLVDCEGLSPFRIPMQIIRSCSLLFQEHFPNCLGGLFVIRLPAVVRVMAQTLMKVLKPRTRQKLKFLGEKYLENLSEFFQKLPACLGGDCICASCFNMGSDSTCLLQSIEAANDAQLITDLHNSENPGLNFLTSEVGTQHNFDQMVRSGILGILLFFVFVAFLAGVLGQESGPKFFP